MNYAKLADAIREAIEHGQTVYDLARILEERFSTEKGFNRDKWLKMIKPVTFAVYKERKNIPQ